MYIHGPNESSIWVCLLCLWFSLSKWEHEGRLNMSFRIRLKERYWLQCSHIHTQIKLGLMSMNDHICDYVPRAVNNNSVINCARAVQPSSVQITVISEMRLDLTQITSPFSIHITNSNQWTSCDELKCAGLSLH